MNSLLLNSETPTEQWGLAAVLREARSHERQALAQILQTTNRTPSGLAQQLEWHTAYLLAHLFGSPPGYSELVCNVGKNLSLPECAGCIGEQERQIVQHLWRRVWEKMTTEQRREFNSKLQKQAANSGLRPSVGGAAITGAALLSSQLSGFEVYILASSTLGAMTGALGIALPFGAYRTMSSILSIVIGPAGWISLGLLVLHQLTGPDYRKLVPAVVMVHCIRARIEADRIEAAQLVAGRAARAAQEQEMTTWLVGAGAGVVLLLIMMLVHLNR